MNKKRLITELDVSNKVVFLRLDLNVPMQDGKIISSKRIDASLPTIKYLLDNNAKIVILSHLGRPKTLNDIESGIYSLRPVAQLMAKKLGNLAKSIKFIPVSTGKHVDEYIGKLQPKSILFLENTRYNDIDKDGNLINAESNNSSELAEYWAGLSEIFVNDAYGAAHRKHASTYGIAKYQQNNAIGLLMQQEIDHITSLIKNPIKPFTIIFGGAKVAEKINAVRMALQVADYVVLSGGMVYTFLAALGYNMGKCAVEPEYFSMAKELYQQYKNKILLCTDFLCAEEFKNLTPVYKTINDSLEGYVALDVGHKSLQQIKDLVANSNSVLWNGPLGVTEFSNYAQSTYDLCKFIALKTKLGATTIIGGGDSAISAERLNKEDSFSWISTGGGATLSLLAESDLIALNPIADSFITSKPVYFEKVILDNKYVNEYINREENWKQEDFIKYANELYEKNILIKNKKNPVNPMENDVSIRTQLTKPSKKSPQINFDLVDPYANYSQYGFSNNVETVGDESTNITKKSSTTITSKIKVIKENSGTTEEELLRLKKLQKKGLSKAGLRIMGLVKTQKQELEDVADTNKK